MTLEDYNRHLSLLGLHGPMGELRDATSGEFLVVYKMPTGEKKYLTPGSSLTDDQRQTVVRELTRHLGMIEVKRNGDRQVDL